MTETASTDRSYDRIRSAAVRLFAERGYVATGIRDIARESGLSLSTLYHHVTNKEELLVSIMVQGFETLIADAEVALADEAGPEDKLRALVRNHVLAETERRQTSMVVTAEFRFLSPEARAQVLPVRNAYGDLWRQVIEEGVRTGAFDVADTRLTRLALLHMCGAPEDWYRPDGPSTPGQIADVFAALALRQVGAG
jgi:AcrR family transcriptional regulator